MSPTPRQTRPTIDRYARFYELFKRWRREQDVVLRQEHKAGEKLFVDSCLEQFLHLRRGYS